MISVVNWQFQNTIREPSPITFQTTRALETGKAKSLANHLIATIKTQILFLSWFIAIGWNTYWPRGYPENYMLIMCILCFNEHYPLPMLVVTPTWIFLTKHCGIFSCAMTTDAISKILLLIWLLAFQSQINPHKCIRIPLGRILNVRWDSAAIRDSREMGMLLT